MATVREITAGLLILTDYDTDGLESRKISVDHDVIYGPGGQQVSEADAVMLSQLGWFWREEVESWAHCV